MSVYAVYYSQCSPPPSNMLQISEQFLVGSFLNHYILFTDQSSTSSFFLTSFHILCYSNIFIFLETAGIIT